MQNVSKLAAFRRGWVSLSQDFREKGSSPCQYIDTTRKAIDCATTLPLTVLYNETLQQTSRPLLLKFLRKTTNLGIWSPFEEVRGGVEPWLMSGWKSHIRLPIRHNWTFFSSSYRWGATRQKVSRLAAIRRGRSVWAMISGEGVIPGEYFLVSAKLDTFCYLTVQSFWQNTGVCQTDGRTDRQTDGIAVASTALAMRALWRAVKTVCGTL